MGDFTFAGEHSMLYHVRMLPSPVSILPGTRDKVITIPGRHGALRMIPDLGERILQPKCWLEASGTTQLHERLGQVRAWLNPLRGAQQLIFDNALDRYYMAAYAGGGLDARIIAVHGIFTVEFICPDPYAYALEDDIFSFDAIGVNAFSRLGTAISQPLIEVRGSIGSGDAIKLVFNDIDIVRILSPLITEEKFVLDVKKVTASIVNLSTEEVSNGLPNLDELVFPELNPGFNTVDISLEGSATFTQLDITCRSRWL